MALHTKKEFAALCGLETKNLATYIGRKKVIVLENDMIDDKDPSNRTFLKQRATKQTEKQVISHLEKVAGNVNILQKGDNSDDDDDGFQLVGPDLKGEKRPASEVTKYIEKALKFKAEKVERETYKLDLELQKRRGEIIPSELVKPIFQQHNQSLMTSFRNAGEDLIRNIGKRKELTGEEVTELRTELFELINLAIVEATESSFTSIDNILNEYVDKRGVGQRS